MIKGVLATDNQGKIDELRLWFPKISWQTQADYNITSAEETGISFIENAIIKARHAAKVSGLPALADDSGIIIDALNGRPGVKSARYAGDHDFEKNIDKVLFEMAGITQEQRGARFCCALAYIKHYEDPCPAVAVGLWEGLILSERVGNNGFGYDPIFFDPIVGKSAAEISQEEKNQISHRAKAIQLLACMTNALSNDKVSLAK